MVRTIRGGETSLFDTVPYEPISVASVADAQLSKAVNAPDATDSEQDHSSPAEDQIGPAEIIQAEHLDKNSNEVPNNGFSTQFPRTYFNHRNVHRTWMYVQKWATENGFAVSTRQSNSDRVIVFVCSKSCLKEHSTAQKCPWNLTLKKAVDANRSFYWKVSTHHTKHSHPPVNTLQLPERAKLWEHEHRRIIDKIQASGLSPKAVLAKLYEDLGADPISSPIPISRERISKLLTQGSRIRLRGEDDTTVAVRMLQDNRAVWRNVDWDTWDAIGDFRPLSRLFMVHRDMFDVFVDCNQVLFVDGNTRSNKHHMHQYNIVSVPALDKTSVVATFFVETSDEEDFKWMMKWLATLYQLISHAKSKVIQPKTIITDRELGIYNAVKAEFPNAQCVVCNWHVCEDVKAWAIKNIQRIFPSCDDPDKKWSDFLEKRFASLRDAATTDEFDANLQKLSDDLPGGHRNAFIVYLENNWLLGKKRWSYFGVKQHLPLGHNTLQLVERFDVQLKSWTTEKAQFHLLFADLENLFTDMAQRINRDTSTFSLRAPAKWSEEPANIPDETAPVGELMFCPSDRNFTDVDFMMNAEKRQRIDMLANSPGMAKSRTVSSGGCSSDAARNHDKAPKKSSPKPVKVKRCIHGKRKDSCIACL